MLKQLILYTIIALLLCSCASQVAPTGGPKDETPPTVIKSSPKNLSLHFDAKKININFDEYVQQSDFASQIFFSPSLEEKPEYRIHGKTLTITVNGKLKPQTTYTVNFGEAIKDITEGNVMVNYQYVFSTGNFIDSFLIRGVVKGAQDGLPKEKVIVMLYNDLSDSIVMKERPAYYAQTDKAGNFRISHLKGGDYKLFALNDQNVNLTYQPGEDIAFSDSAVSVNDTTAFYTMSLFRQAPDKQKILSATSPQPGRITMAFAGRTERLTAKPFTGKADSGILQLNATKDTAYFWLSDLNSDSISVHITDANFSDTAYVRMKIVDEKQKIFAPKFTINSSFRKMKGGAPQEPDKPVQFEFSVPVIQIDQRKTVQLINDSTKDVKAVVPVLVVDSITKKQKGSVSFPFAEKTKYTLIIPDSAFENVYGKFNDSTSLSFTTFEKAETGNLLLKITTDSSKNYFYELQSAGLELIAKDTLRHGLSELKFISLRPGNYTLKVIEDPNHNRNWDTGNYWKHVQPEKIYNYTEQITLRANWDLDVEMNVGTMKKFLKAK